MNRSTPIGARRALALGRAIGFAGLVGLAASCAEDGPRFTVNYAPGFAKDGVTVSVFGVFRDGRMNPEAWDDLGPKLAGALHKDVCEVAVGSALRAQSSSVFAAVDGVARADGITDELLEKFAPAASGDSILVIVIAGHPPKSSDGGAVQTTAAPSMSMGRGGRGRRGAPRSSTPRHGTDTNVFEMSASLYSKRQRQSVAMVAMTYTGPSEEDAVARFVAKVATAFPGATCAGWEPELGLDPAAIRQLAEP